MARSEIILRLDGSEGGLTPEEAAVLRPPVQTPDGRWRLDGIVARGGEIKDYPTGAERAEWSELSRPEVVAAFEGLPVTVDHKGGLVAPGSRNVLPDARVLRADAFNGPQILRASVVFGAKPSAQGLSVGWLVGAVDTSTTPPTQRALTPNHLTLALASVPRSKGARLRLDGGNQMASITIDTHTAEVPDAFVAAYERDRQAQAARLDAAVAERDAAKGELVALKAAAPTEAAIRDRAKALATLWTEARPHLKAEVAARLDAMTEREIREAVIASRLPALRLDAAMSDDTIRGIYLGAIAAAPAGAAGAGAADIDGRQATRSDAVASQFMGRDHFKLAPLGANTNGRA